MKLRLVRGSEVQDFLRCRKRWKHKWVDRFKAKRPEGKLFFGNLIHKAFEVLFATGNAGAGEDALVKMFNETDTSRMAQTDLDDLLELAVSVYGNYVRQWSQKDADIRVIATEFTFAIPLANGIAYTGTIDKLWLDGEGKLWFADYKTTSSISKYIKRAKMDRQISRYFWALQQLANGEGFVWSEPLQQWIPAHLWRPLPQPHGFIYDIVMRDVPKVPKTLVKGGLSKAKDQHTTHEVYRTALREHLQVPEGEMRWVPEEYVEILEHLLAQEDEWGNAYFRRVPVYRHPEELESAIQEFYAAAADMIQLRNSVDSGVCYKGSFYDPIYRNITDDCGWDCSFQTMCIAQMDGTWYADMEDLFYEREEPGLEYLELAGE